jgi:hypothetical protein
MVKSDEVGDLEAESNRILAEMDNLRRQLVAATDAGQGPQLALLEKMEATSRRFREVSERMQEPSADGRRDTG